MKTLKLTKLLAGTLLTASILALNPIAASAEWKQDNKGWWYTEGDSWSKGWREIDGYSYYFKSNGYMLSNSNEMYFDKEYGLNSSGQFTNVIINGDWAFCKQNGKIVAYLGSESIVNIPSQIDDTTVTGIGAYAFSSSKITSVTIPSTVTVIGVKAFSDCSNLTNLTIPNSVKGIATYAFDSCKSLTNITIPSSANKIGDGILRNCLNLTNVTVENGVTFLGHDTFSNCTKLSNVILPNTLTYIGERTFEGCISLKNIVIPSSVTLISNSAFYYCINLTSLALPDGLTEIGSEAFKDCINLTSITIPSSVKNIITRARGPFDTVPKSNLFEGCNNVMIYVKSDATKQLLANSGVNANRIITTA